MVRVLACLAAVCAVAYAVNISPKVDLPGVVKPRRPLGTDILDEEKVQAVLQVKVKSARPDNSDTKVNAVVCVNSDSSKCGKKEEPAVRPSIVIDDVEDDDEEENEEKGREDSDEEKRPSYEEEEDDEEQVNRKQKRKQVIVILDEDPIPEEKKKSKRKKVGDVPVIMGYSGVTSEEESKYHHNIHIPNRNSYHSEEEDAIQDVPVYTGLKLSPEFDKPQETYSYLNPPQKDDVPVTYRQIPTYGFEESALVAHVFETSPLIKALKEQYISNLQPVGIHRVTSFNPRVSVSDIPDYVAGVESQYHHQPIPGFYGGHQPGAFSNRRGIVKAGAQGCYYSPPVAWNPRIHGKVAFTGDEEDIHHSSITPSDADSTETSDAPTVIKIDGKLGGPLESQKT